MKFVGPNWGGAVISLTSGYDIIGDIHGCADTLVLLLERMDYQKIKGVYQHKTRKVIFLGDVVDRGPHIREALHIVRDMVDGGHAEIVMGNHEYNAITYCTPGRPGDGREFLRRHDARHTRQIAETLEQFAHHPQEWQEFLGWFQDLPLFIEKPGFRVVHACWDDALISQYKKEYGKNTVDRDFIYDSVEKQSFAGQFLDRLTRGIDMPLANGRSMTSRDGYTRQVFRTRFWGLEANCYRELAFQPDPLPEDIAALQISEENRKRLCHYGPDELPLFIGHYWLNDSPAPLAPNVACLDYSAVKYGRLAAYRMDGERQLSKNKYVWVYVDREQ